ncbi:MAG TPA: biotin--[acetyl-CoA-carboxylase] ligase [Treponema sp.]|nr:biotin--[acetyl-CoA-carboxylase] ligase [Treponema sp.]HBB43484.1 biotin--[acetyl-CoA-carboxylase] ligase [Treponema sp.]
MTPGGKLVGHPLDFLLTHFELFAFCFMLKPCAIPYKLLTFFCLPVTLVQNMGNETTSTKYKILKLLRDSSGPLSGENAAKALGISRTSVWKAVQSLQDAGYGIESTASGYMLAQDLDDSIFPCEFGEEEKYFTYFKSTESTMIQARKIAQGKHSVSSEPEFRIVTADEQTKGRGKGNRVWKTTKGSLAFTLVTSDKKPHFLSERMVMASQIALCESLRRISDKKFFLRWPNDVWTEDGKVAGILDELFSTGSMCSWQNLGIGINIHSAPHIEKTDRVLDNSKPGIRREILRNFCMDFSRLKKTALSEDDSLSRLWNSLCMDYQKEVKTKKSGTFVFAGINAYGCGILKSEHGCKILVPGSDSYVK